jgi:hypothetical protein
MGEQTSQRERKINAFIASPGDVKWEREQIALALSALQRELGVQINPFQWEWDTATNYAHEDPQATIDSRASVDRDGMGVRPQHAGASRWQVASHCGIPPS